MYCTATKTPARSTPPTDVSETPGHAPRVYPVSGISLVRELRAKGVGLLECARRLNLSMNTVKRYDRAPEPEAMIHAPIYRPTLVDPYREHLRARRAEDPAVPLTHLLGEITRLGYTGSANLLMRYIAQGRVEADHVKTVQSRRIPGL